MIGATPALGRFFQPDEGAAGADGFLVLSDRGWRERFDADPAIVGRGVNVDGRPFVIVGVAKPGFQFPDRQTLFWTPMAVRRPSPDTVAGKRPGSMSVLNAVARVRRGATTAQAEAEGTAAARATIRPMAANLLFGVGGPPIVHVRGMVDEMTAGIRPALLVLAAGVGCVLLIACANVANLFLARGVARQRELTVRAAIGASTARLARQLVTESLVLSLTGGALGLALAWALMRLAQVTAAHDFPRLDAIRLDGPVLAFTVLTSLFTAIAAGLAPALRGSRFNLAESLHGGDGASAGGFRGRRARRMRDGLLAAEGAFAVLLIVAAVLLARSFVRLTHVDAGYTADRVLAAQVYVPGYDAAQLTAPNGAAKAEHIGALMSALLARVRATPGVTAAGAGNMMPLDGATQIAGFPAPWTPPGAAPATARSLTYQVTPGYAEALALRLRRGRLLTDADQERDAGGSSTRNSRGSICRRIRSATASSRSWIRSPSPNEVVGIVANVLKDGNDRKPQAEISVSSGTAAGSPDASRLWCARRTTRRRSLPACARWSASWSRRRRSRRSCCRSAWPNRSTSRASRRRCSARSRSSRSRSPRWACTACCHACRSGAASWACAPRSEPRSRTSCAWWCAKASALPSRGSRPVWWPRCFSRA